MVITSDLHTHTTFSHGAGSVEDNVISAIKKGLLEIAIADHSVKHMAYGIRDIEAYLKEIDRVKSAYKDDITVKSGIEMNLLGEDGELDLPKGYETCFDILLFGYHKFAKFKGFANAARMLLPKSHRQNAVNKNTDAYISAVERYNIDIITHPGYGLPIDKIKVARAAAKRGTRLEINAKHPEFTIDELRECANAGVKFSINSDAHSPDKIGCVKPALEKAEAAGLPYDIILNARQE